MGKQYSSIIDSVFHVADVQCSKIWHYESEYYYKGTLNMKRKNLTAHFLPNSSYYEDGGRTLFSESAGTMEHTYDLYYSSKELYRYDAVPDCGTNMSNTMEYFNLSIYSRYLLRNQLLSPLNGKNSRFYKYNVERVDSGIAHITFTHRIYNSQMVSGYFLFDIHNQYVTEINFSGDDGLVKFTCNVTMGKEGEERYWPVKNDMIYRYHYYGNIIDGHNYLCQKYNILTSDYDSPKSKYGKYDMTYLFATDKDTTHTITDSLEIAKRRMLPLTAEDKKIYDEKYPDYRAELQKKANESDQNFTPPADQEADVTTKWIRAIGSAGEIFFNDYDFDVSKNSRFSLSSLRVNYSGWRGITLREDLEYSKTTATGRHFALRPLIGYNFRPQQLVWNLRMDYNYQPRALGQLTVKLGNRGIENNTSRIHSKETGKLLASEDDGQSVLFNDWYWEIQHSHELFNGFMLSFGIVFMDRVPLHMNDQERRAIGIEDNYTSFAPHICITYTPGQTFYFRNNRKILLESKYPTFCLDYERSFFKILDCDNQYEKWEAMVTQSFPIDPIHQMMWKIGAGMFTNMSNVNFVDFRYFNDGIADYNWTDEWAGIFQLLDSKYYYNSQHYLRGHIVLQSPNIILGHLGTRFIRAERVYVNGLVTEGLAPYLEMGYGVSTALLDISFFTSYIKRESLNTGLKFSLHLN